MTMINALVRELAIIHMIVTIASDILCFAIGYTIAYGVAKTLDETRR